MTQDEYIIQNTFLIFIWEVYSHTPIYLLRAHGKNHDDLQGQVCNTVYDVCLYDDDVNIWPSVYIWCVYDDDDDDDVWMIYI